MNRILSSAANGLYQGPVSKEHNNDSAKLIWLIGGLTVVAFIIFTSLCAIFCNRKKPIQVTAEPVVEDETVKNS